MSENIMAITANETKKLFDELQDISFTKKYEEFFDEKVKAEYKVKMIKAKLKLLSLGILTNKQLFPNLEKDLFGEVISDTARTTKSAETNFYNDYCIFIKKTGKILPSFIFDDYDLIDLYNCFKFQNEGKTLLETEKYYEDNIKRNDKIK